MSTEKQHLFNNDTPLPPLQEGYIQQLLIEDENSFEGLYVDRALTQEDEGPRPLEALLNTRMTRLKFAAGATMAILGAGAAVKVTLPFATEKIKDFMETKPELHVYTYQVKPNENLSTITTNIYKDKSGNDDWVNNFIDNNIVNTTKDDRPRDRNTIYTGDILEITLDPEEGVPITVLCPIPSNKIVLKDSPDCVEDPN